MLRSNAAPELDMPPDKRQTLKLSRGGTGLPLRAEADRSAGRTIQSSHTEMPGGDLRLLKLLIGLMSVGVCWAQVGGYGGPSILSRGGPAIGRSGGQPLAFRFYASVHGTYDAGLTAPATDAQGRLFDDEAYGLKGTLGAYGYQPTRRSITALEYRGHYRHYSGRRYYNGTDHFLALSHARQLSRRVEFSLAQGAGTYGTAFGGFGFALAGNPVATVADPGDEIFDGRTHALISTAGLNFQKSARLLFSMSGTGFLVRRRSRALVGVNGYGAAGSWAYALSRRNTVGAGYHYGMYTFERAFGRSDIHSTYLFYGRQLSRIWLFRLGAGVYRAETQRLVTVRLDPVVAAIIGYGRAIEAFHGISYSTGGQATLMGRFRRSVLALSYRRGVHPGNGFYLTSRGDFATAYYSFTGTRRWSFGLNASYGTYSSLSQSLNKMEFYGAGAGANYRLTEMLHFTSRVDFRHSEVRNSSYDRERYRVTVGFTFSPGDIPLSLW